MNEISFEKLIEKVKEYNDEAVESVTKAYKLAEQLHSGVFRQSGEPYIIHPLNVAYTLAELHADSDTLCAGLLHDTIEDTDITKEEIKELFNEEVAKLVDGVTKISKMNFSTKQEQSLANTRKIITSITDDVRIIIIKLADRLHNMRTLQFKKEEKQKENALETMEIFVPLAYYIGAYRIKSELEDLSFKYLKPDMYDIVSKRKLEVENDSRDCLENMLFQIKGLLEDNNVPNEIKVRTKNIYGIYKRVYEQKYKITDIHDLLSLKIMVDTIPNCYQTLGMIHSKYNPVNEKFKDYIYNPKTNMYRSLHTTVYGPEDRLVQTQIRTFDMDKIASFGLTAYFDINKGEARNVMQEELKDKFQFFKSLHQINKMFTDNEGFVKQVKDELFSDRIYVSTPKGEMIELPKGSTIIDFAFKIHTDLGLKMTGAIVNNKRVPVDYELQNKDRVKIIVDSKVDIDRKDWINKVHTTKAKRKLLAFENNVKN